MLTCILLATAEERPYRPMFKDGHQWTEAYINDWRKIHDGDPCIVNGYIVNGDTLIDGKLCKRICDTKTMLPVYYGFEEDKKVYVIDLKADDCENAKYKTYLMADFGVSKGDSIAIYNDWDGKTYYQYCTDEGYINVDGEEYRWITMSSSDMKLIEGVGWQYLRHSISPGMAVSGSEYTRRLISSYDSGKWVKADVFSCSIPSAPGVVADTDYQSLLNPGNAWTVIWYNLSADKCLKKSKSYRVSSEKRDINGVSCTKIVGYNDSEYWLCEEGKKVFLVEEESGKMHLLYDFNVHKGDKVRFTCANDAAKPYELTVISEEEYYQVNYENIMRLRRITFEDGRCWIEGLGSPDVDSFATIFSNNDNNSQESEVCFTYLSNDDVVFWDWKYLLNWADVEVGLNEPFARPYADLAKRYDLLGRELSGEPAIGSYYIEGGKLKKKI